MPTQPLQSAPELLPNMFGWPVYSSLMFQPNVGMFWSTRVCAPLKEKIVAIGATAKTLSWSSRRLDLLLVVGDLVVALGDLLDLAPVDAHPRC